MPGLNELQRFDPGLRDIRVKPFLFQVEFHQLGDVRLIFDDQNFLRSKGHGVSILCSVMPLNQRALLTMQQDSPPMLRLY